MLEGKKTQKMHIRLTEDLAREVRAVSDLEHRPYMDQLRLFIVLGLQMYRQGNRAEMRRSVPHGDAQAELPMPPVAAPRRTEGRKREMA